MTAATALVISLLLGSYPEMNPAEGQLCIYGANPSEDRPTCLEVRNDAGVTFPAMNELRFASWLSEDSGDLLIGTIAAGSQTPNFHSDGSIEVNVDLLADAEAVMGNVVIGLGSATLTSHDLDLRKLGGLLLPDTAEWILFQPRKFRSVRVDLNRSDREIDLRGTVLVPLPVIRGEVREADDAAPVPGAALVLPDGVVLGHTGRDGRFVIEMPSSVVETWPGHIQVVAEGFGIELLALPTQPSDVSFSTIGLRKEASLALEVYLSSAAPETKLRIDLHRVDSDGRRGVLRSLELPANGTALVRDLPSGTYWILIRGSRPLEAYAEKIHLDSSVVTARRITIQPVDLSVEVRVEGDVYGGLKVELEHSDARWKGEIDLDDDGRVREPLWQLGRFVAITEIPREGFHLDTIDLETDESSLHLKLDIPRRLVRGEVVDDKTGRAIANATVLFRSEADSGQTATDEDGSFEFAFLRPGRYELEVRARGFLPATNEFPLEENSKGHTLRVELTQAAEAHVRVISDDFVPVAGAKIFDPTSPNLIFETDEHGQFIFLLHPQENRRVYIVHPLRSFTIETVSARQEHQTVVIPPGPAELEIAARTIDGNPVSRVGFVLHLNGERLPNRVLSWLNRQGSRTITGVDGIARFSSLPLGVYDIFPVFSQQEANRADRAVLPVRVAVQPGVNSVGLTFALEQRGE